jgi:hypothetical protein
MCSSPGAYVEAKITSRLIERGVDPERARAVGRKVKVAYEAKHALHGRQSHLDLRRTSS